MSKLNPTKRKSPKLLQEQLAGGLGSKAARLSNINALRRITLANLLWENNAYADGISISEEIKRLIPLCNAEDVYDLVVEAKLKQKLRHTPLFITREMCRYPEHNMFVADLLAVIITRADMLTDFLAIYWKDGKEPICNQAKKGLATAFYKFNEYQLAKYDRNSSIKLRDVMFLVRPKPRNEAEKELFKKIANRTLQTPDTWEVELSKGANKKTTWTRLIKENKLGGLAMLRNIRNMRDASVEIDTIREGLTKINSNMLLPLNFYSAYLNNPMFKEDIESTMLLNYKDIPKLPGKTLFIVDVSGSMDNPISGKSTFSRLNVASVMAMFASFQCEQFTLVATAGSDGQMKVKNAHIQYPSRGFGLIDDIQSEYNKLGYGGIFTKQCLEWCKKELNTEFERIIVFSDSQDVDTMYDKTKLPKPFGKYNYICDISSEKHGINYRGVWTAEISGWSEHFLTYIAALEGIENKFIG